MRDARETEDNPGAGEGVVPGAYPELARLVRQTLGRLSSRAAAGRAGVSHATIATMARGERVSVEALLRFAHGFNCDPAPLLAAAGYPPLVASAAAPAGARSSSAVHEDPLLMVGTEADLSVLASVPMAAGAVSANLVRVKEPVDAPPSTLGEALPGQVRAIRVDGDCMEPFYESGDVLLVRETGEAASGDKVIALVDWGGVTCKVFRGANGGGLGYLEPADGGGRIEADRFRILGVVVGFYRSERR